MLIYLQFFNILYFKWFYMYYQIILSVKFSLQKKKKKKLSLVLI